MSAGPPRSAPPGTPLRVLYVEDNPLDADLVRRALQAAAQQGGQAVALQVVSSLAAARQCLQQAPAFAVLLVDIGLPDGSGLDLVRELRQQGPPLAVVALTSQGDEDVAVAALKAGADDYLAKSNHFALHLPALLAAVLQRLHQARTRHQRGLRVLYAEHHAVDVDLTRRHFAAQAPHIRLDVVADSHAVLQRLPAGPGEACAYDVLLLDYRLTPETGLDLLQQVRSWRGLDLPVVLVSGQGSEPVAVQALRLGASDYVVKHPNYLQGLAQTLENAYHRVALERERALLRTSEAQLRSANLALEARVAQRTDELLQARDAAERASQAKSDFLSGVSHELRTPMNAVLGFAQLLARDAELPAGLPGKPAIAPLAPLHLGYVQHIQQAGAHLMTLIDELLDLASIEAGRLDIQLQTVDLPPLLQQCLSLVGPLALARQVQLQAVPLWAAPTDAAHTVATLLVLADPRRLKQVLLNLLGNAIKYNHSGGQVALTLDPPQAGQVRLCVSDTGPGLSAAQQAKLFQAFERLDAGKTDVPGMGIGLALCRRLAGLMGAEIGLDSVPGSGSTFWLRLPCATVSGAAVRGV